jgi:hypothetical protein
MPPLDDTAKPGSRTFDRALSLVAAFIVVAGCAILRPEGGFNRCSASAQAAIARHHA